MKTFTCILEFKGGTYISQVKSRNLKSALGTWVKTLNTKEIKYLGEASRKEVADSLKNETPIPVNAVKNVWCLGLRVGPGFMLLNVIQTDISE